VIDHQDKQWATPVLLQCLEFPSLPEDLIRCSCPSPTAAISEELLPRKQVSLLSRENTFVTGVLDPVNPIIRPKGSC
jgi:hypothetical protein